MDPLVISLLIAGIVFLGLGLWRMRPGFPILALVLFLGAAYSAPYDHSVLNQVNETVVDANHTVYQYFYTVPTSSTALVYISIALMFFAAGVVALAIIVRSSEWI